MADIFSKTERSELMSHVRSTGNKSTELKLIAILRAAGISGWRRNEKLFGHPDFVFRKKRLAIFVDGCFWHGCPLHYARPKTNKKFWENKILTNRKRDREVTRRLRDSGWKVIRIWQHSLKQKHEMRTAARIRRALDGQ